jgi:hypothetical protein
MKILKSIFMILLFFQSAQSISFDLKSKLKDITEQVKEQSSQVTEKLKEQKDQITEQVEQTKEKSENITEKNDEAPEVFDIGSGRTLLMAAFFQSNNDYKQAFDYLEEAYDVNVKDEQKKHSGDYARNSNMSDEEQIINSIKVTTERSRTLAKAMDANNNLSDEGKLLYAKSLPFAAKGLIGTLRLAPITTHMIAAVKSNPLTAIREIGGVAKVLPQLPGYMINIRNITQKIISGAKANDIKSDTKAMQTNNDLLGDLE